LPAKHKLDEEDVLRLFYTARDWGFRLSWNILCPACGGVLDQARHLDRKAAEYTCALCADGVNRRSTRSSRSRSPSVRGCEETRHTIPGRCPGSNITDRSFWSSGVDLPDDETLAKWVRKLPLEALELSAGEKVCSRPVPEGLVIVFRSGRSHVQYIEVNGEPHVKTKSLSFVMTGITRPIGPVQMRPRRSEMTLENVQMYARSPPIWIVSEQGSRSRQQASPLLDCETSPDQPNIPRHLSHRYARRRSAAQDYEPHLPVYRPQRLNGIYERVWRSGCLRFGEGSFPGLEMNRLRRKGRRSEKTIGDAVMATFPDGRPAMAAAIKMREALKDLKGDLLLKIGIHEGPLSSSFAERPAGLLSDGP